MTRVLIWNNNIFHLNSYPGHASMLIGDLWSSGTSFVSWLPGDKGGDGRTLARQGENVLTDMQFEKYAPDHILEMPAALSTPAALKAMRAEWGLIRTKQNAHYRFQRKNCSTIVARVLKSSGVSASFSVSHSVVWTPLKAKRLALDMGGQERTWDWLLADIVRSGLMSENDSNLLRMLNKRDEKHGAASGNSSYYAHGKAIAPKIALGFTTAGLKFHHAEGRPGLYMENGSMLGGIVREDAGGLTLRPPAPAPEGGGA